LGAQSITVVVNQRMFGRDPAFDFVKLGGLS
jgi:hypothetical protein